MNFGDALKKARISAGLTQKQLCEMCGMADSAIRKYESGKIKPKIETTAKLAKALNVDIPYFYELSDFEHVDSIQSREYCAIDELALFVLDKELKLKYKGATVTPEVRKSLIEDGAPYFAKKFLISSELIKIDCEKVSKQVDFYASQFKDEYISDESLERLNAAFRKLSDEGQKIALERVEELAEIPKYQYKGAKSQQ